MAESFANIWNKFIIQLSKWEENTLGSIGGWGWVWIAEKLKGKAFPGIFPYTSLKAIVDFFSLLTHWTRNHQNSRAPPSQAILYFEFVYAVCSIVGTKRYVRCKWGWCTEIAEVFLLRCLGKWKSFYYAETS